MKINLFDINNVLITLKAFVIGAGVFIVGYLAGLIMAKMPLFGGILLMAWTIFTFFLWGYLARKWWGWK